MKKLLSHGALLAGLLTAALVPAHAQKRLKAPKPDEDKVYETAAQPATPAGGTEAFAQYLADHQNYPTAALQRGAQGTVLVSFIVEKSGALSHVEAQPPVDADLDREAIRLIKASPRWTPALNRGQKVRMHLTIPITFQIPADATPAPGAATPPAEPAPATGAALPPVPAATNTTTRVVPDQPARPPQGTDAFFAWIQEHLTYPAQAKQRKVEGRVVVEFMIQPDGTLTDVKPVKRLGSGCDEEAVRLIQAAPRWLPATYQGKPIKQKMVLPVVFQLP